LTRLLAGAFHPAACKDDDHERHTRLPGQARGRDPREREEKERRLMPRTKHKFADAAESIRPYLERMMTDEKLRHEVLRAFGTARELYEELVGDKNRPMTLASRVATDDDIRDKLRNAIDDLRRASDRLQGKRERSGERAPTVLIVGITLGILFNPVTGPETRRFIKDMLSAGGASADHSPSGSNSGG
jgi:hypothetical protein